MTLSSRFLLGLAVGAFGGDSVARAQTQPASVDLPPIAVTVRPLRPAAAPPTRPVRTTRPPAAPARRAAGPPAASSQPAEGPPVDAGQISIYANQAPSELRNVGTSVTVMTGDELRSQGYSTLADALRLVPGVAVSQSGTRGSFTQVRIRGAEANHLLVTIDDIPVNDISDGDYNFADFALEDIARVEVVRGPQSGIYGANAHAGVIAILTKSGRGLPFPQADLRVEGGSRKTGSAGVSARGASGPVYGSVSVDHYNNAGYNVSRFGFERDGGRAVTATAKAGADVTPELNIEAVIRSVQRHTEIDSQPFFGPFEGLVADSAFDFNKFRTLTTRIAATWALFDGNFVQRIGMSRYDQRRNDDDVVSGFFRTFGWRENLDYKAIAKAATFIGGGEQHTLTYAYDKQAEFLTIDSASFQGPFGDPVAGAFWANGARRERFGNAGEYQLDLWSGLTVTGAVRRDINSGFANITTWRSTASQRIWPTGTRLHASVGKGVTNPTFIEQFGFFVGLFRGNPDLKPEESIGWDVGVEQTFFGGRLITDVTFFKSDFKDKITLVSGVGFISTPINVPGVSPRRGVEVSLKWVPADWLALVATYTNTDARLADGTPEVRRPRHAASGSATIKFADGRGRLTLNAVYNGAMPDQWFRFPITPVILEAYTVVGGILAYDVTPHLTAYVRAENLFNASYEEVFSYRAPGFAAFAGLKARFGYEAASASALPPVDPGPVRGPVPRMR